MPRSRVEGICSVEGCEKPIRSLGFCNNHYQRQYQFGRLHKVRSGDKRSHPHYSLWFERKQYGALAPEWLDFWQFAKDIGERPSENHFLQRLRDEPYGPTNFEWYEKLKKRPDETQKEWWARKWASRQKRFPTNEADRTLRRKYGFGLDRYNEILTEQGGVCAICHCEETTIDSKTGGYKRLSVDHCHRTGKVRELLCWRCNSMVGYIEAHSDNGKILAALADYLKKHQSEF